MVHLQKEIANWARLSRENKLTEIHQKSMMNDAYDIDRMLREIGVEWINDYEANQIIKSRLPN